MNSDPASAPVLTLPVLTDEQTHVRIVKEGISYVLESRSVSTVARFIYTPIDGTLADLELEINSMDPILPADGGGITVEMGGNLWPADSEEVERRLVSCEQVGDCIEARWQWKHGDELADFLFRLGISGKSLVLELEGGGGKATGVDAGQVTGATHASLVRIPYLVVGKESARVLCTHGVFISSLIDWQATHASALQGPGDGDAEAPQLRLNGGCTYARRTDGRRCSLHERMVLTVSRHIEEVLPIWPQDRRPALEPLKPFLWYNLPTIPPGEEGYVEIFEQLREFHTWGLKDVLVNHPEDVWHDGDGNVSLHLEGAPAKGGDDALEEYLEALRDLGVPYSLPVDFTRISESSPRWDPELAIQLSDGTPAPAGPAQYRLRLDKALELAEEHTRNLVSKYSPDVVYVRHHAAIPPSEMVDCAADREGAALWTHAVDLQRRLLASQVAAYSGPVIGDGGTHWLYPDLLHGHLARMEGGTSGQSPLLVDFALRHMRPGQVNAGVGTLEQFLEEGVTDGDHDRRAAALDHFLATTVAFGHAGVLPDPATWGLPAVIKTYYMLHDLQSCYLGVPVDSIQYHHDGNLLGLTEAIISGGYAVSQVLIEYANGLKVYVNGSRSRPWQIEHDHQTYLLLPGSFLASMPDGPLVYSADKGTGRVDMAQCSDYFYCDTRMQRTRVGPLLLEGAALLVQHEWEIDILPVETAGEITVDVGQLWPGRRLPPLRLLAFRLEEERPETVRAVTDKGRLTFEPAEAYHRYRIALPEWMVEPGH